MVVTLAIWLGVQHVLGLAQKYPALAEPKLTLLKAASPEPAIPTSVAANAASGEYGLGRLSTLVDQSGPNTFHVAPHAGQSLAGASHPPIPLWEPGSLLSGTAIQDCGCDCAPSLCEIGTSCCNSRIQVPPVFVCRANASCDGSCWLAEFYGRVVDCDATMPVPAERAEYRAWWDAMVTQPAGLAQEPKPIQVEALVQQALVSSPHIQVAATEPHIQNTVLVEEQAKFDWRAFLEAQYDDLNDPIGNTLTTGNNDDRFTQREFYSRGGLRRKNAVGGEFDISQRIGTLRNNSRFLIPPEQGNSRLELNYTQPLLNGRGRYVNESMILLARIDYHAAGDQFLGELQSHLLLLTEAYWELYRSRANFFQRRKLLESAEAILENLQGRSEVDALDRQVLRATAAVASRKSEISRAVTRIRNAQSQLRLLVNDPSLLNSSCMELLPTDMPLHGDLEIAMGDAITTALGHRPDISQAIRELRSTTVRLGVAKNDLLPQLDLLVSTYVAGLNGNADVYAAYVNQFNDGRPGFTVGLQFEVPLGNRAAWARHERRKWELTRAVGQFRAVTESALTEVEVAYREVATTHQEMLARFEAMRASSQETDYLVDRWQTLPEINDSSTLLLEDLLDSQERLTDEEDAFVQAQVNYAVALVKLRQSMGTLMQVDTIVR